MGAWERIWSTTAANSDGTECANCHAALRERAGPTAALWTTLRIRTATTVRRLSGTTRRTPTRRISATAATSTTTPRTTPPRSAAGRRNGHLPRQRQHRHELHPRYNSGTFNCSSHCHFNPHNTNHNLADSGWTVNPLAGPVPACDSCHGGSGNFWPSGSAYPDRRVSTPAHQPPALRAELRRISAVQRHRAEAHVQVLPRGHPRRLGPRHRRGAGGGHRFRPDLDTANPPNTTDAGSGYTPGDGTGAVARA